MNLKKIVPQNKRGQLMMVMMFLLMAIVVVIGIVALKKPVEQTIISPQGGLTPSEVIAGCPDNRQSSITVDVQNDQNSTGTETFDTTLELYDGSVADPDSSPLEQLTDTTAGASTLTCGQRYMAKILSTSGASGDSGLVLSASGSGLKDIVVGPNLDRVFFTPTGESGKLVVKSQQHATQRVRVFNIIENAFMDDDQDDVTTDYETVDGTAFEDTSLTNTGANSTAVGSGGTLSMRWEIQSAETDTNLFDVGGMYVLIDATSSVWDVENPSATASIDGGVALELIKDPVLSNSEKIAYTDYEIIYKIPYVKGKEITNNKDLFFSFDLTALAGQDPTTANNVSVDFAPIGSFASVDAPNILKIGAVDDTTARTDLHTRFDTLIAIQ